MSLLLLSPLLMGSIGFRQNFDSRILASHNRERAKLGAQPLVWNGDLSAKAKVWADHLAKTGKFEHSPDELGAAPVGENLWMGTAGYYQPESMVGLWIDEKQYFKPGVFPNNSRTGNIEDVGHYTQLVWGRTYEVGCALSSNRSDEYLVCRYRQAGNVMGEQPI